MKEPCVRISIADTGYYISQAYSEFIYFRHNTLAIA